MLNQLQDEVSLSKRNENLQNSNAFPTLTPRASAQEVSLLTVVIKRQFFLHFYTVMAGKRANRR